LFHQGRLLVRKGKRIKMIPVYSPNLPTEKVSAAVVGSVDPRVIHSLEAMGVWTLTVGPNRSLPAALCRHADLLAHPLGNGAVLAAQGESRLCNALSGFGFAVTCLKKELAPHYPGDVALNAARIGNRLVCNEKATAPELLEAARQTGLEVINVRQGYAKCSLCIVSENAVITADEGLACSLNQAGLDVLKIIPGCIRLPGYGYGFIGGCCGKLDATTMAFAGDILTHPDGKKILSFLESHGVSSCNLLEEGEKLLDIGSILPVMQE